MKLKNVWIINKKFIKILFQNTTHCMHILGNQKVKLFRNKKYLLLKFCTPLPSFLTIFCVAEIRLI
jgi:hypothetical protein